MPIVEDFYKIDKNLEANNNLTNENLLNEDRLCM